MPFYRAPPEEQLLHGTVVRLSAGHPLPARSSHRKTPQRDDRPRDWQKQSRKPAVMSARRGVLGSLEQRVVDKAPAWRDPVTSEARGAAQACSSYGVDFLLGTSLAHSLAERANPPARDQRRSAPLRTGRTARAANKAAAMRLISARMKATPRRFKGGGVSASHAFPERGGATSARYVAGSGEAMRLTGPQVDRAWGGTGSARSAGPSTGRLGAERDELSSALKAIDEELAALDEEKDGLVGELATTTARLVTGRSLGGATSRSTARLSTARSLGGADELSARGASTARLVTGRSLGGAGELSARGASTARSTARLVTGS